MIALGLLVLAAAGLLTWRLLARRRLLRLNWPPGLTQVHFERWGRAYLKATGWTTHLDGALGPSPSVTIHQGDLHGLVCFLPNAGDVGILLPNTLANAAKGWKLRPAIVTGEPIPPRIAEPCLRMGIVIIDYHELPHLAELLQQDRDQIMAMLEWPALADTPSWSVLQAG